MTAVVPAPAADASDEARAYLAEIGRAGGQKKTPGKKWTGRARARNAKKGWRKIPVWWLDDGWVVVGFRRHGKVIGCGTMKSVMEAKEWVEKLRARMK
jgi:hypothetical protein